MSTELLSSFSRLSLRASPLSLTLTSPLTLTSYYDLAQDQDHDHDQLMHRRSVGASRGYKDRLAKSVVHEKAEPTEPEQSGTLTGSNATSAPGGSP